MKLTMKFLSVFLALLMFVTAYPITAFAAKQETYIKEVRISTAASESDAKQWLVDNGYTVLDVNLNQKTGKDAVYMGYLTTTNPKEAITDIALMQMDGGYSFAEYEAVLKKQEEEIRGMLENFTVAVNEFRANYAKEKKNAVEAYKMLNHFREDDSGKLLGDFIMDHGDDLTLMTKLFMQSNSKILILMYQMFTLGCTDYGMETNWLSAFSKADPYGDYNPLEYDDAARKLFNSWVDFRSTLVKAKSYLQDMNEVGGGEEYTEMVGQGQSAADAADIALYLAIESYTYNGKSMIEFFMQDPNEVDLEDFYPMLSAMTPGQIECAQAIGFKSLAQYALMDDERISVMADTLKEQLTDGGYTDVYSVYVNVDRSLFNGEGVALTNQALRESASTGESAWFKGNMDPGIETMLYVFTGFMTVMSAVFTTLAVTTAGPAKAALSFYMSYGF